MMTRQQKRAHERAFQKIVGRMTCPVHGAATSVTVGLTMLEGTKASVRLESCCAAFNALAMAAIRPEAAVDG